MCYTVKMTSDAVKLINRFKAEFPHGAELLQMDMLSGFAHPLVPVITNREPEKIELYQWGLIPKWAKDKEIRKNTLNARIETIEEKPSYRNYTKNRCLILIDGFYEYQWLDSKGKSKQRYLMTMLDREPFALGGLWSTWTDSETGEIINSFTILTIRANEQMSIIHNSKKRMPLILSKDAERDWLMGITNIEIVDFILSEEKGFTQITH